MEQIIDITECCICAEMFTDPRILPCIHTFCLKCLEATRLKSEANEGDTMPCPICIQQFTIPPDGLRGLQKNFFVERLTAITKISKPLKTTVSCDVCLINKNDADTELHDASKYCVECRENMCEICSVQHKHHKLNRGHEIVLLESLFKEELVNTFTPTYCSHHTKEELKMYCADCKKVICMKSFAENHQLHKCSEIDKEANVFRDETDIFLAIVVECSQDGLERKLKFEEGRRKFMEDSEIAETAIKDTADEMKKLIDDQAKVLLDELAQRKSIRMKENENKNEEIERYLAIVNSFNAYCSEIKSKGTPSDICRSVHDLRARANELLEVNATQNKQDTSSIGIYFTTSAIENILKVKNIVGSLEEETEWLPTIKVKKEQPVSDDFIKRLCCPFNVQAVTTLDDKIYVLCSEYFTCSSYSCVTICIFGDQNPFQLHCYNPVLEILRCQHIVSSDKLKCLYVSDSCRSCVWKLTADRCRVSQRLTLEGKPISMSMTYDGQLLLLTDCKRVRQLEIYGSDAKISRRISLSRNIMSPFHVMQKSSGQFIIFHKSDDSRSGSSIFSALNSDGQIFRTFRWEEKLQELMNPYNLCLDSENDRLFVVQNDEVKFSVVMLDLSSLEWKHILLTPEDLLPICGYSLHYDERKKELLVGMSKEVYIFQIY